MQQTLIRAQNGYSLMFEIAVIRYERQAFS